MKHFFKALNYSNDINSNDNYSFVINNLKTQS